MTIYVTDDAFSVKAKRFNKMFTSILALFFLLRYTIKLAISLGFSRVDLYTESTYTRVNTVHAFSSRSGNLNFGPKSGYKINVGFGLVFSGSSLTIGPVSNSDLIGRNSVNVCSSPSASLASCITTNSTYFHFIFI